MNMVEKPTCAAVATRQWSCEVRLPWRRGGCGGTHGGSGGADCDEVVLDDIAQDDVADGEEGGDDELHPESRVGDGREAAARIALVLGIHHVVLGGGDARLLGAPPPVIEACDGVREEVGEDGGQEEVVGGEGGDLHGMEVQVGGVALQAWLVVRAPRTIILKEAQECMSVSRKGDAM